MFLRILEKEMKRKKGINLILFFFILIATIFVSSSLNNLMVVRYATRYCMEKGKVPDDNILIADPFSMEKMDEWLDGDGSKYIKKYTKDETIPLDSSNIKSFGDKDDEEYDILNSILVQSQFDDYLCIYDKDQNEVEIKDGEIAMQKAEMERNGLESGDSFVFQYGDYEKEFKVADSILDPAYGGEFLGMTRYFISEEDYEELAEETTERVYFYNIKTDNVEKFSKYFNREGLSIVVEINRALYEQTYMMSMLTSGILIILGVCLILIAFFVLKFTINVTLQEDYKEIGIMKAIGMRDFGIKKIYLVKYFSLSVIAAAIGGIASFPVGEFLIKITSSKMMMPKTSTYAYLNAIGAVAVLVVVMMFCYLSTGKLKKFSAMEAIRNGAEGEKSTKGIRMRLHGRHGASTVHFLSINEVLSNRKRYITMLCTFLLGIILVILCANTVNTFHSDGMVRGFLLDPDAEAYLQANKVAEGKDGVIESRDDAKKQIKVLEEKMKDKGYDADIYTLSLLSVSLYTEGNKEDARSYRAIQSIGNDGHYIELIDGKYPDKEDEIVVAEKIMDKWDVEVGDTVHIVLKDIDKEMKIVGSYQNYMQMGESILLSTKQDTDFLYVAGLWFLQIDIKNDVENLMDSLKDDFEELAFLNAYQAMDIQLGNIIQQLNFIKALVLGLVCAIFILLTVLMMKIFILGEKGKIAMLQSVGFSTRRLRRWYVERISIVLIIGVVLGAVLSIPLNTVALKPIFGMMGATHMGIKVNLIEDLVIYPIILLVCVIMASSFSSGNVSKINVMEVNNME